MRSRRFQTVYPLVFALPVEKVNQAYPELFLKGSVASKFQQICNVWGPRGRVVKVHAS